MVKNLDGIGAELNGINKPVQPHLLLHRALHQHLEI